MKFKVETNWCVITGAPCSGKTTVLKELEKHGYRWSPEIARIYIEQEQSKGFTLEEIRKDEGKFQKGLIETKLKVESETNPQDTFFFDRAMPDSITYYRAAGLNPDEVIDDCLHYKYKRVFIFDPLPYQTDNARIEDKQTVDFLDEWLEKDYEELGYDVIRVPAISVSERVEFILSKI